MPKPLYIDLPLEKIALSGPHAWPNITAEHAADRFIFRRPELAYLVALQRMIERRITLNRDPQPPLIGIRYRRTYYDATPTKNNMHRFSHLIRYDDPQEDVVEFLTGLRRILAKYMPNKPLVNCGVNLRFYDYEDKKEILSYQDKWL